MVLVVRVVVVTMAWHERSILCGVCLLYFNNVHESDAASCKSVIELQHVQKVTLTLALTLTPNPTLTLTLTLILTLTLTLTPTQP